MPLWVASIIGGLVSSAGTLVGRVLISMGFGLVVFTGVDSSIEWARSYALSSLGGMPAVTVGVMSVLNIGTSISMLCSALLARMAINGLTGGTFAKYVTKAP